MSKYKIEQLASGKCRIRVGEADLFVDLSWGGEHLWHEGDKYYSSCIASRRKCERWIAKRTPTDSHLYVAARARRARRWLRIIRILRYL